MDEEREWAKKKLGFSIGKAESVDQQRGGSQWSLQD